MREGFIQRGGYWVAGQGVLMLAVGILGLQFSARGNSALRFCGFVLLCAAGICGIAGVAALGKNLTPFPRPSANARFISHGIYRLMRHPLYTAVFCAALGWSLMRQSWPALGASVVLGLFFDTKARREERWLEQRFPNYRLYRQRVRRFFPWIY